MESVEISQDVSLNIEEKFPIIIEKNFTQREGAPANLHINLIPPLEDKEDGGSDDNRISKDKKIIKEEKILDKNRIADENLIPESAMRRRKTFQGTKRLTKRYLVKIKCLQPFRSQKKENSSHLNAFILSQYVKSLARKMIAIIRNNRFFSSIKNLKQYHFDIINDKGSFMAEHKGGNSGKTHERRKSVSSMREMKGRTHHIYEKTLENLSHFTETVQGLIPVFNPNHFGKIFWDFSLIVLIMLCLYFYTLKIGFSLQLKEEPVYNNFKQIFILALFLDIFISLNTIFYKEGIQVTDRSKIFYHYLRTKFLADVFACVGSGIGLIKSFEETWKDMEPFILYKLLTYHEFEGRLKSAIIINIKLEALYKIFILILKIFFIAHLIACVWHYIGFMKPDENKPFRSWLSVYGIENESWTTKYLYSIYWGITTMLTVGYGDITPTNKNEVLFNIWAMFIGCGLFGYSMNHIGDIIHTANQRESLLRKQLTQVRSILRRKNLPKELQMKVMKYLEFIWEQEVSEDPEQENLMMTKLSSNLRDEIYLHTHVKHLKKVKVFRIFSDATLIKLASHMRKVRFSPEEFVYKSGEKEDYSLYLIIDGKMERISEIEIGKTESRVAWSILKSDDYFGLHELITGMSRASGILARDFSSLFQLSREDFLKVIKRSPEEYVKKERKYSSDSFFLVEKGEFLQNQRRYSIE